jgi:predicted RNA-binding protein YlxR (DUF448 family)
LTGKHVPIRTCLGCGRRRPKRDLLRLTVAAGRLRVGCGTGRGLYICPNRACLEKAAKSKALRRTLGRPPTDSEVGHVAVMVSERDNTGHASTGLATCSPRYGGGAVG